MARAVARKKTMGGKSNKSAPSEKKTVSAPKIKASAKKALKTSVNKLNSKIAPKIVGKGIPRTKVSAAESIPPQFEQTRAQVEPQPGISFAEKPARLLSETKSTSAALAILERGIKSIYHKDFKKARAELSSLLEHHPNECEILARARTYMQICDREDPVRKKPATPTSDQLYTLGVMDHNRGNFHGSIAHFRQLLEKGQQGDHIYYSLAASLARIGDIAESLNSLKKAITLNEDNRIYAKNDSDFEPLHTNREFAELAGLSPEQASNSPQS